MISSRKELHGFLEARLPGRTVEGIVAAARWSVCFHSEAAPGPLPPGTSKIGGDPDMPASRAWPMRQPYAEPERLVNAWGTAREKEAKLRYVSSTVPLHFAAQVNLRDCAALDDAALPGSGMLYFFADLREQPWGFDPRDGVGFAVLFAEDDRDLATLTRPPCEHDDDTPLPQCRLAPRLELQPVPPEGIRFEALGPSERDSDLYSELFDELEDDDALQDGSRHRVRGYADNIQNPMEEECALVSNGVNCGDGSGWSSAEGRAILEQENDWELLFQLESDECAELMFGDLGSLYFWIRREDLLDRRFENCWMILQCS